MKKTDMTGFARLAMLCVLLFISSHFIYAIYLHILTLGLAAILTIVPSITTYWADPAPVKTSSDLVLLIGTILIFLLTIVLGILVRFFLSSSSSSCRTIALRKNFSWKTGLSTNIFPESYSSAATSLPWDYSMERHNCLVVLCISACGEHIELISYIDDVLHIVNWVLNQRQIQDRPLLCSFGGVVFNYNFWLHNTHLYFSL